MSQRGSDREQRLTRAFVGLADTLVDDYDVIELLDRLVGYSVELLVADAAGILLAHSHRTLRVVVASSNENADVMELLQTALNSRVIIEQVKGVLAQRGGLRMDVAFDRLRHYARTHNARLSEVARRVVETGLAADVLNAPTVRSHAAKQR